jgi:allophanate hydrolase
MYTSQCPNPIFIDPDAFVAGAASGPLAGRRFAIKDNFDVAGTITTAACPEFSHQAAARSATVVERLLAAGASLAGKTNLDQFACGLVGVRSPYGAVRNPFDERYVSGGSSSGSAVAVSTGLVDFSIGTDTAGSGRVPAAFNNIVGLKPSRGLVSSRGMLPACRHLDCTSIFARTVGDAIDVLKVIAGFDAEDPFSRQQRLDPAAMPARFRFGVPRGDHLQFYGDEQSRQAFEQAVTRFESLGGTKVEIDWSPFAEAATALYEDAWVAERYAAIREFADAHAEQIHPVVAGIVESGKRYSAADLFDALARMTGFKQRATIAMAGIDVIVVPSAPTIYTIEALEQDPIELNRRLGYYTNAVNLLDLCAIAVPSAMRPDGLPFGITVIGPWGSELRLAELAGRYHHATGLTLGCSDEPVPEPRRFPRDDGNTVQLAVVGAHLDGLPLNFQLQERGARFVAAVNTAPHYRLYALAGTVPPKPGLLRVADQAGAPIACEIWEMPTVHYGSFVAGIPAPLGIGSIELDDGRRIQGFLCEGIALAGAEDISAHGGWRHYLASRSTPLSSTGT